MIHTIGTLLVIILVMVALVIVSLLLYALTIPLLKFINRITNVEAEKTSGKFSGDNEF